jgi:hypothetical protein
MRRRANWRGRGTGPMRRGGHRDSLRDQRRTAPIQICPTGQAEVAGIRNVFRAGAAGHSNSMRLVVVMGDGFLIGDRFIARHLGVRLSRQFYTALARAGRVDAEHRDQLLQLLTLTGRTSRLRFQNQRFKLLSAIQAFKIV